MKSRGDRKENFVMGLLDIFRPHDTSTYLRLKEDEVCVILPIEMAQELHSLSRLLHMRGGMTELVAHTLISFLDSYKGTVQNQYYTQYPNRKPIEVVSYNQVPVHDVAYKHMQTQQEMKQQIRQERRYGYDD